MPPAGRPPLDRIELHPIGHVRSSGVMTRMA
jgi:hypothetical protein